MTAQLEVVLTNIRESWLCPILMPPTPSLLEKYVPHKTANVRAQELRKHELSVSLMPSLPLQLTSQDKTPAVIQRAMVKHNLDSDPAEEYELVQVISEDKGGHGLLCVAGGSSVHILFSAADSRKGLMCFSFFSLEPSGMSVCVHMCMCAHTCMCLVYAKGCVYVVCAQVCVCGACTGMCAIVTCVCVCSVCTGMCGICMGVCIWCMHSSVCVYVCL